MTNENSRPEEPQLDDSGHLSGFEFESDQNAPTVKPEDSQLTVGTNTAGLDEPEPSLRDKQELDELAGPEPESDLEDGNPSPPTPGVGAPETPLQPSTEQDESDEQSETGWQRWYRQLKPILGYLPTGVHEEDTERDGILSYSVEVHASIIGLAIGMAAATTGNTQLVMALVAVALGVGRTQQRFSEKVTAQLKTEPWYALSGAALGYAVVYVSTTGQLPPIP